MLGNCAMAIIPGPTPGTYYTNSCKNDLRNADGSPVNGSPPVIVDKPENMLDSMMVTDMKPVFMLVGATVLISWFVFGRK